MSAGGRTDVSTTLPQELNEFLLELALALQRMSMYPGGHPSVDEAVVRLTGTVQRLVRDRATLSLGVARRQIVVEGVATETSHPVLAALAERLHRHRLGALLMRRGIDAAELQDGLSAVAADPERTGERLGEAGPDRLARWPHLGFYRVTYEQLKLNEEGGPAGDEVRGTAAAQLWMGLARAAIETGAAGGAEEAADTQPADVAAAINDHPAAQGYDQMVVGYMLQLAGELRQGGGGAGAEAVGRRVSEVVRGLDSGTLERLLRMGGDDVQRARFLSDATEALRPDAVLEIVKAAAHAQGEDISTSMLRLLRKMSVVADVEAGAVSERAAEQMRGQVRELLDGWTLEDPNPDAYTKALERMSGTSSVQGDGSPSPHAPEPLRLLQMGIELEVTGPSFWRAVDALVADGGLAELFSIIDGAGPGNETVDSVWVRLETADHIRRLLTTDPVDFDSLDRIFERMQAATVISLLLDRLSESVSRGTRMGVFRRLTTRGLAAVPQVMERLADKRWYVLRNMLALLGEIGSWPKEFSPLQYATHGQAMVRREAVQLAVLVEAEREQAICVALADSDERTMRIGVNAAREAGLPGRAVITVLQRLAGDELSADVRAALIRLLGRHATAPVIERLAGIVVHERRLVGRAKLAAKTPELLAAVAALAAMRTTDPRARTALQLARASGDAEIRSAADAQ